MAKREDRIFVLRFRREGGSAGEPWRGRAFEIGANRSIASSDVDDITDFVKLRLTGECEARSPADRAGTERR